MVFNKSSKILIVLVMLISLVMMAGACLPPQTVMDNNIPDEKLALENFLALYTSFSVSFDENLPDEKTDDENTVDQMIAKYNQLNKEGKITYLRNMIEKALAENEAIGGIKWMTDLSSIQYVGEAFPDLYERIMEQANQIHTRNFSWGKLMYHIITNADNKLLKVVELDTDKNMLQEKTGGANLNIIFEQEDGEDGSVEIVTDAENHIKSITCITPEGDRSSIQL